MQESNYLGIPDYWHAGVTCARKDLNALKRLLAWLVEHVCFVDEDSDRWRFTLCTEAGEQDTEILARGTAALLGFIEALSSFNRIRVEGTRSDASNREDQAFSMSIEATPSCEFWTEPTEPKPGSKASAAWRSLFIARKFGTVEHLLPSVQVSWKRDDPNPGSLLRQLTASAEHLSDPSTALLMGFTHEWTRIVNSAVSGSPKYRFLSEFGHERLWSAPIIAVSDALAGRVRSVLDASDAYPWESAPFGAEMTLLLLENEQEETVRQSDLEFDSGEERAFYPQWQREVGEFYVNGWPLVFCGRRFKYLEQIGILGFISVGTPVALPPGPAPESWDFDGLVIVLSATEADGFLPVFTKAISDLDVESGRESYISSYLWAVVSTYERVMDYLPCNPNMFVDPILKYFLRSSTER